MSILIHRNTRAIVQGMTGSQGRFHAAQMMAFGTRVVGGVTPGKGGESCLDVPVFNTVRQAVRATGADASVIFVPPAHAASSILEAADAGIGLVVCITEGIPVQDMLRVKYHLRGTATRLIGPNCPGIITPEECKLGIIPGNICMRGHVGIISRSGTLTYEAIDQLTRLGIGQSTAVGIGGDPVRGSSFVDMLRLFNDDPQTLAVVLIGEIGGNGEEQAAEWISENMIKPVAGFIAGRTAPPGRRMGHAGAIITGGAGTAEGKVRALEERGIVVAPTPDRIGAALEEAAARAGILEALKRA